MSAQHKTTLGHYINWLFKQYQELKKTTAPDATYRLAGVEEKNGVYHLTIQVIGKATTLQVTPTEILSDDALVEHFSSKDIRTITYYATEALIKPKNKIVIKRFCERLNQVVFGVKHVNEENISEKTADEISLDKKLLNELTPEEAHMVGYTSAQHVHRDEKIEMDRLRQKKEK